MKALTAVVVWSFLSASIPAAAISIHVTSDSQTLLTGKVTERAGIITFTLKNISGKPVYIQKNYCNLSDPEWKIELLDGRTEIKEIPVPSLEHYGCLSDLIMGSLLPGETIDIARKINLKPGSYIVKSWILTRMGMPDESLKIVAPPVKVNIP